MPEELEIPGIGDQFQVMSDKDRLKALTSLPVKAQMVLISLCGYFTSVSPHLLEQIRDPIPCQRRLSERDGKKFDEEKAKKGLHWTPEEFDDALGILMKTKYVVKEPDPRLKIDRVAVVESVKSFVNTDLRRIWEEQEAQEQRT